MACLDLMCKTLETEADASLFAINPSFQVHKHSGGRG